MNNAVEIEELLKAEEERDVRYGCKWADRVRELIKYRNDHGHCNVPQRQSSLGSWVHKQRTKYKELDAGKYSSMTLHRVKILNDIGFVWDASDKSGFMRNNEGWMQMFEELTEYKEKHGNCVVPRKYGSNPKLANWVNAQRQHYQNKSNGKSTQMTEERQHKLEEIGFVWDASDKIGSGMRIDEGWMRMFEELIEYKKKHGNCLVPSEYKGNPKLGRWVSAQRKMYHDTKKGKSIRMTKERQHNLEGIGFVWKVMRWKVMR